MAWAALAAACACGGASANAPTEVVLVPPAPSSTVTAREPVDAAVRDAGGGTAAGDERPAADAGVASLFGVGVGAGGGSSDFGGFGIGHYRRIGGGPYVAPASATVQGSLPKDMIRRVIRAHEGHIRACYEQALQHDPSLAGRLDVSFVVDAAGHVSSAQEAKSTLADPNVGACVVALIRTLHFPAPSSGVVRVHYPFIFQH